MPFQLFSSRRPPEFRERKRQPDKEVARADREKLEKLRIAKEAQKNAKEFARVSYGIKTPEDDRALLDRVTDLQNQIDALYARDGQLINDEIATQQKEVSQLQFELNKLIRLLPDAEYQHVIATKKEKEMNLAKTYEQEFDKNYEKTAHETIRIGIQRLAKTLEEIQQTSGQLPTVILFPETSSRPLCYAIQPLVDQLYTKAGQTKPQQQFVKIFTDLLTEEDLEDHLAEQRTSIAKLKQERLPLIREREKLIRRIKSLRGHQSEREELSQQVQIITDRLHSLHTHILQQQAHVEAYQTKSFEDVTRKRLQTIRDSSPTGSILVIDDLISEKGRTVRHLHQMLQMIHPPTKADFFAFFGTKDGLHTLINAQKSQNGISPDHLSVGVVFDLGESGVQTPQLEPALASRIGASTAQLESAHPEQTWEFGELYLSGFPYRMGGDKENSLGVKKDIDSSNPFVTRSPKRNIRNMQNVRAQYAQWGQEAVDEWLATKTDFKA